MVQLTALQIRDILHFTFLALPGRGEIQIAGADGSGPNGPTGDKRKQPFALRVPYS